MQDDAAIPYLTDDAGAPHWVSLQKLCGMVTRRYKEADPPLSGRMRGIERSPSIDAMRELVQQALSSLPPEDRARFYRQSGYRQAEQRRPPVLPATGAMHVVAPDMLLSDMVNRGLVMHLLKSGELKLLFDETQLQHNSVRQMLVNTGLDPADFSSFSPPEREEVEARFPPPSGRYVEINALLGLVDTETWHELDQLCTILKKAETKHCIYQPPTYQSHDPKSFAGKHMIDWVVIETLAAEGKYHILQPPRDAGEDVQRRWQDRIIQAGLAQPIDHGRGERQT